MTINLGILFSHKGNLVKKIIKDIKKQGLQIVPKVIISNNNSKKLIQFAKQSNIPAYYIKKDLSYDLKVSKILKSHQVDLIILLNYFCKVKKITLDIFKNKIINIHPALLPKYGGKGMYGINIQKAVIALKDEKTGVTAHIVTKEYDQGRILKQWTIKINKNDNVKSLSKKIHLLEQIACLELLQNLKSKKIKN